MNKMHKVQFKKKFYTDVFILMFSLYFKRKDLALGGVVKWIEHWPVN